MAKTPPAAESLPANRQSPFAEARKASLMSKVDNGIHRAASRESHPP